MWWEKEDSLSSMKSTLKEKREAMHQSGGGEGGKEEGRNRLQKKYVLRRVDLFLKSDFFNPEVAAPLLSEPVFSSGQYFSRSMPMVYSAPKSHEGSYLHQRRESRGARCLEGTFATLRVLVPRSCGSTMDQHERYHRLHKDADISSICRSRETKHPIDTLINPSHLRDHYYFNDTLTFDTSTLLKEEFGFSGIGILAIVHELLHSLDRMSMRIVFLWSVGTKQYHADSQPLERTIDGSGVLQTYGAEGESRWRTALRYKAIERAWSGTC
ncbi:hypothetical protein G5I_03806 [Acromyrmex echinatior]|uniref:Uncharacterized protein n=1 Tax=Acromyrmex echinatior TaxID=103372 RepID=F4WDY1_ACREC|nr:hypothetical protein G5I_03806 [Acromyrmex echinatior]